MIKSHLRELLKERGLTQKELVSITGIRQPTLSAISTDRIKTIPILVMDKICSALKCQPGDLFEHIPENEENPSQE